LWSKKDNLRKGKAGEETACRYLRRRGFRILARNYRSPFGELDIVATRGGQIVFCEVKTRTLGDAEEALGSVDATRRRRMAQAASHFLDREGASCSHCRFDVIALLREGGKWKIMHVEDAFEVGDL